MTIQEQVQQTVSFLQVLLDRAEIPATVDTLSDADYDALVYDERSVLNWLSYYPLFCDTDRAFHFGLRMFDDPNIDGAMLGIYDNEAGKLHIILIESLIYRDTAHPLQGRLVALVTLASIYFLALFPNSSGVYIVEPVESLIPYYETFGFELIDGDLPAMYASFETLFERQQDFVFRGLDHGQ